MASRVKAGSGGTSRVAVEQGIAVIITHKSIQVPIAIDIGKGGCSIIPHIRQSEGVGNWGVKIRVSHVSFLLIQVYG